MYLDEILLYDKTPLKDLKDSDEKKYLENLKIKLIDIEHLLKEEPNGCIKVMYTSQFVVGFSKDLTKLISDRIYN